MKNKQRKTEYRGGLFRLTVLMTVLLCAVSICLSQTTSQAKYVKQEGFEVDVLVNESSDQNKYIDEAKGAFWLIDCMENQSDSVVYDYWINRKNDIVNRKTLDSTGGNFGMVASKELSYSFYQTVENTKCSFCMVNSISGGSYKMIVYFINTYIGNMGVPNRVDQVYRFEFPYSLISTSGTQVTFSLSYPMTYTIGTMGLTTKELVVNGNSTVMTMMDGNFIADQNGERTLTQAPDNIPPWQVIP